MLVRVTAQTESRETQMAGFPPRRLVLLLSHFVLCPRRKLQIRRQAGLCPAVGYVAESSQEMLQRQLLLHLCLIN